MKKTIIVACGALLLCGLAFVLLSLFSPEPDPCDILFEQVALGLEKKTAAIQSGAENFPDNRHLSLFMEHSRKISLNLKECCLLFHADKIDFDEFLKCQDDYKNFETNIDNIILLLGQAAEARNQGQADLNDLKLDKVVQAMDAAVVQSKKFQEQLYGLANKSSRLAEIEETLTQAKLISEAEPNDNYSQATVLPSGVLNGKLTEDDQEDYFQLELRPGSIVYIDFTPNDPGEPMNLSLQNLEREDIWFLNRVVPGVTKSGRILLGSETGSQYYLVVSGGAGQYEVILTTTGQDDAASGMDAGDVRADALEISSDRSFMGELGGLDRADWYLFKVPAGYILNLSFAPAVDGEPLKFSLGDIERQEFLYSADVVPGVTKSSRIMLSEAGGGTFYLRIYGGSGTYQAKILLENQNDGDSGSDAGDKITKALSVGLGGSYSAELGGFDAEDWFQFNVPGGHKLNAAFSVHLDSEPIQFSIFDLNRNRLWTSGRIQPGMSEATNVLLNNHSGGNYFVSAEGGNGLYRFEIWSKSQDDGGSGKDAGDTFTEATHISAGQPINGEMGDADEADWYSFSDKAGGKIKISLGKEGEEMKLSLINREQRRDLYSAEIFPGSSKSFGIPDDMTPPYYIKVHGGKGRYVIKVE